MPSGVISTRSTPPTATSSLELMSSPSNMIVAHLHALLNQLQGDARRGVHYGHLRRPPHNLNSRLRFGPARPALLGRRRAEASGPEEGGREALSSRGARAPRRNGTAHSTHEAAASSVRARARSLVRHFAVSGSIPDRQEQLVGGSMLRTARPPGLSSHRLASDARLDHQRDLLRCARTNAPR